MHFILYSNDMFMFKKSNVELLVLYHDEMIQHLELS